MNATPDHRANSATPARERVAPTTDQNPPANGAAGQGPLTDHVHQNIEGILTFHRRETGKLTGAERWLESFGALLARPVCLAAIGLLVAIWIAVNLAIGALGRAAPDPPPFGYLQGLLTLAALVMTTIVLIAQRRQAHVERSRDHLDLQVNLLTEQKVSKVIHLLEELRRDLPMVQDRVDPAAATMQRSADPAQVLSALEAVSDRLGGEVGRTASSSHVPAVACDATRAVPTR